MDICQSCSMPLRTDGDRGTNADGGVSQDYCHFCYQRGKFTDEGITMEQKIDKLVGLARAMSIPEENARRMAQTILPTLKRWRSKQP
ncbi:MAG: zinc ribbon domain-containing protein [Candidatus Saganbacteria bacterium]|nr:zinc ribbon domain-containing protein [Candidatus Saganbacteria bacterium]